MINRVCSLYAHKIKMFLNKSKKKIGCNKFIIKFRTTAQRLFSMFYHVCIPCSKPVDRNRYKREKWLVYGFTNYYKGGYKIDQRYIYFDEQLF